MAPKPKTFVKGWRMKLALYFVILIPDMIVFLGIRPSIGSGLPYGWLEFLAAAYFIALTFVAATGELYRNRFWKQLLKS